MHVRVVLVEIEGPVNLGFIARTCMNFEVDELFLVSPKADLNEARRFAARAGEVIDKAVIVDTIKEAINGVDLVAATTAKGYGRSDVLRQAISIRKFIDILRSRGNVRLALLFGRESTGLTRRELGMADFLVTIPASPRYPVLNISHAVAIFLWELWILRGLHAENVPPPPDRRVIEEILSLIRETSKTVMGGGDKAERVFEVWRKVIWRAGMTQYESRLIKYWLQKVNQRLKPYITRDR